MTTLNAESREKFDRYVRSMGRGLILQAYLYDAEGLVSDLAAFGMARRDLDGVSNCDRFVKKDWATVSRWFAGHPGSESMRLVVQAVPAREFSKIDSMPELAI